ncbi:MAG: A/G-specific adenine glycosylase [Clostridia bacterium]|nr:A/G-specific adenine glycosylase [Clostridia bacterium]
MTEQNAIYAALPERLLPWYRENARDLPWRRDHDPYRVWVSEIMLQQTRVEAVIGYYDRFMAAFPTVEALAAADEARVLKLWEGLGYYSRARNLQKAAKVITGELGGVFPDTAEGLLKLPGIGAYTAGAVASICFERRSAAVDGNVLRIITRMTADERPIDLNATKQEIGARLEAVHPAGSCGDFTQALMELGACVCTPKSPKCGACPMRDLCRAHIMGKELSYPVKLPKAAKKREERTVFLLRCENHYAVCRREEKGLLAGLWQFPNCGGALSAEQAVQWAADAGANPAELIKEVHRTHIFTHIRWDMMAYLIVCRKRCRTFTWAEKEELEGMYMLPTAFRIFLEDLE